MGLDFMDVILRIERTFAIDVRRKDQEYLYGDGTVGALYQGILQKLQPVGEQGCLGARLFYHLRGALVETFQTPFDAIAPSSPLESVIPADHRRRNWRRLGRKLDLFLPALRRPPWLRRALLTTAMVPLLAGGVGVLRGGVGNDPLWVGLAILLATGIKSASAHAITIPFAVCLPDSCKTVKDLIKTLLRNHYGQLALREKLWHPVEVWHVLQEILVESLNVDLKDVRAEAHLLKDLGME